MPKPQKSKRAIRVSETEKTHGYKMRAVLNALLTLDSVELKDGSKVKPSELTRDQERHLSNASCREILERAGLKKGSGSTAWRMAGR